MKTLLQVMIFPAMLAVLLFFLFSQTSNLLEEPSTEERILGVTHQRDSLTRETTQNQKLILFPSEFR